MYDIVNETKKFAEYVDDFEIEYIKSVITKVYPDVDLNNIEDFRKFYVMMSEKNDLSKFRESEAAFLQERAQILQDAKKDLNDRLLENRQLLLDERKDIVNKQKELSNEIENLKNYIKDNSNNKSEDDLKKEIAERKKDLAQKIGDLKELSSENHKRMLDFDSDLDKVSSNLALFYDQIDFSEFSFFGEKEKNEIDTEEEKDPKKPEPKDPKDPKNPEVRNNSQEPEIKNSNKNSIVPKELQGKFLIEKFNSLRDFEKVKFLNSENGYERLNNAVDMVKNNGIHLSHSELKTLKLNCSYLCYTGNPELGNGKLFKNKEKIKGVFTKITGVEEVSDALFDAMYCGRYRGSDTYVQCNLTSGDLTDSKMALISGTIDDYAQKVKSGKLDEKDISLFKSLVYSPMMMAVLKNKVSHMGVFGKVKDSFSVNFDIFAEYEKMAKKCLVEPPELEEIKKQVNNNPVSKNAKGKGNNNQKRKVRNGNDPKGPGEK